MIAGRYQRGELIGRGSGGAVYGAIDTHTGEPIALKILVGLDEAARARLKRELAALRWLDMPGVVRLRDDGPIEDDWFIAMDRVDGLPFPGVPTPAPWERLRGPTLALVELIGRVHAAGVLHRDLKPANVLVHAGRPTLLDFGVSRGAALAPAARRPEHSGRWAAPEQLRNEAEDERTDLFSLGRLLEHALDPSDAPSEVTEALRRMLRTRRADRPSSAADLLALLGAPPPPPRWTGAAQHPEEMRPLFIGGDRFEHLQEDAASLLFARTQGEMDRVNDELRRWIALGVAREVGPALAVDRVGLDRLMDEAAGLDPLTVSRRALAARSVGPALAAIEARATTLTGEGRPARAQAALSVGLGLARATGAAPNSMLARFAASALAQESVGSVERGLYELERSGAEDPGLEALLRGARAAYRGEGRRALELLDGEPMPDEELETWRLGLRVRAAGRIGLTEEEAELSRLEAWAAGTSARQARWWSWWGNLRYRQGRYAEGAVLHRRAAEAAPTDDRRISAQLNAALCLLEVPRLDEVQEISARAEAQAARLRLPVYEGYAVAYQRAAAYRSGHAGPAQAELVGAAERIRPHLAAQLALNEAAVAWRSGDSALALGLATRGRALFSALGHTDAAALCGALARASGGVGDLTLPGAWRVPDLGLQALGLLALSGDTPTDAAATAPSLAEARTRDRWGDRLDVLSVDEALAAMGLSDMASQRADSHG